MGLSSDEILQKLTKALGRYTKSVGNEILWACPGCQAEGKDSKGDNFAFNTEKKLYNCVANSDHNKIVSDLIRQQCYSDNKFRSRKMREEDAAEVEEMPQEIVDYWRERKISLKALKYFKIKYDKSNVGMVIPTQLFKDKYKPLFYDDKGKWNFKKKSIGANTLYPVKNQYEGQKKFLYLEGIPDVWAIYSNFPEQFFNDWYVSGTVHGATFIPKQWEDPRYWNNFEEAYICADQDQAGEAAAKKLQKLIGDKAKIITLPLKHRRIVNGQDMHYPSKDFNDWIIEGGTYEEFLKLINKDSNYDVLVEQAAWEFLKAPDLIDKYLEECEVVGYVGEIDNKVKVYFENCSRLSRDKNGGISSKGQAPTAVGKTTLYKMIGQNFFMNDFIILTDRSPKVMLRKKRHDWRYKIVMTEENYRTKVDTSSEDKDYQMRIAKSEGILTYEVLIPDKEEGYSAKIVELEGPFVFQEATTKFEFKDEDINRDMVHHFDESSAQTSAIVINQKKRKAKYDPVLKARLQFIKDKHVKIQEILKDNIPDIIIIPFSEEIDFPIHLHRARRDFPRLSRYIETCALLHQFQRKKMTLQDYLGQEKISEYVTARGTPATTCNSLQQGLVAGSSPVPDWVSAIPATEMQGVIYHLKKQIDSNPTILLAERLDFEICRKFVFGSLQKEYVNTDVALVKRYDVLYAKFGAGNSFTAKDAAEVLGCSREFARKTLKSLEESELSKSEVSGVTYKYTLLRKSVSIGDFNLISLQDGSARQEKEKMLKGESVNEEELDF